MTLLFSSFNVATARRGGNAQGTLTLRCRTLWNSQPRVYRVFNRYCIYTVGRYIWTYEACAYIHDICIWIWYNFAVSIFQSNVTIYFTFTLYQFYIFSSLNNFLYCNSGATFIDYQYYYYLTRTARSEIDRVKIKIIVLNFIQF